jgi:glycosyltransferase involved in cell wall biosynthesis
VKVALLLPVWDDPTLPGLARDLAAELGGRASLTVFSRARERGARRRFDEGGLKVRLLGWVAPPALAPLEEAVNAVRVPLELAAALAREAPDLAHYHFSGNDAWLYVALAAPFLRSPLLVTLHNQLRGFPGRPRHKALCGAVLRRAAAVSAVSEAARLSVAEDFPWAAGKTRVIANGVDVPFFARSAGGRPHARRYLLTLSRAAAPKGLDILLMAFAEAIEARADVDLLVCGPEDDGGHFRRLAGALRLDGRVRFLGLRPKEEVARLLRHCEALALGSRVEGHPLSALEALASGVPVVATDVPGNASVVSHGVNGLLAPPKDPRALAAALGRVLDDASLRGRLAEGARAAKVRGRAEMAEDYLAWWGER